MRKPQIGVIGSSADLKYSNKAKEIARKIGRLLAKNNCILIYGAEKDYDSLGTEAARGAKEVGGLTVGITYEKHKNIFDKNATDIIIPTGLVRGGGREIVLVLACDSLIAIGGGSGTLNEIAIAYQADIPVVVIEGMGGWSEKLKNKYLDERKRYKIEVAKTAEEAVEKAIKLAKMYQKKYD